MWENYSRENFYNWNTIKIGDVDETNETIVFSCQLSNLMNKEQNKEMTIAMKLEDDSTNFAMSFSFSE